MRPVDLASAWCAAVVVEPLLVGFGLRWTIAFIERTVPQRARIVDRGRAERYRRAAVRAYRLLPFTSTCLRRSLVEFWLDRLAGIDARLVIGVRSNPAFGAHAWVEVHGEPGANAEFAKIFETEALR